MNRLAAEASPYLRQHAENPVDWYPWGEEAFERARHEDRPVFLSVGYSACHWCHVMAHESFEDAVTAGALNDAFVSIKVDREERPDVDAVYMEAVQAMTGGGGWPMSVFLTPDRRPFYGGTYFPPVDRAGAPVLPPVLAALHEAWTSRRAEVEEQAGELSRVLAARSTLSAAAREGPAPTAADESPDLVAAAAADLAERFDPRWGGFGPAPKFPHPALVDLLLLDGRRTGSATAARSRSMAITTLDAMAAGGIHDHLGGGFARYATDTEWLVPHFEKMLYDQAGLLRCYLHGWQETGRNDYLRVVEGIVGYVGRDLTTEAGGVCSAEDADSGGVEGAFYVWTRRELDEALDEGGAATAAHADEVATFFGVREGGNFEGRSILRRPLGAPLAGPPPVETGRRLLRTARDRRVRPGLDGKVLTEWNAMYAGALAEAAAATGDPRWAAAATAIGRFLCDHLRREDGRWLRSWQQGHGARHLAYAADYAWLVDCFTRLAELTGRAEWSERAVEAADDLLEHFGDEEGGFFTTGHDAEQLLVRTKDVFDGATPSANAVAALALTRLGALTGEDRYTDAARGVVALLGNLLGRHPTAFAHTVLAAVLLERGTTEVVIAGDRPDLVGVVRRRWLPDSVLAWGERTASPLWDGRETGVAYVCRRRACRLPVTDAYGLVSELEAVTG